MKEKSKYAAVNNRAIRSLLIFFVISSMVCLCLFIPKEDARAEEYHHEAINPNYLFNRSDINMNIDNAVIDQVDISNPQGVFLQEINGFVREGDEWHDIAFEQQGYTIRIPVRAIDAWDFDNLISNTEGQALLDGLSISVTWKDVGTFTQSDGSERPIKLRLSIANMQDALPKQRMNNAGPSFSAPLSETTNARDIWGSAADMGHGYMFKFLPSEWFKSFNENYECHFHGIESGDLTVELVYEDDSPVMLDDGEGFLMTVGQIDADFLGVEGIRIANNPEKGFITSDSSLVHGNINRTSGFQENLHGFSPSLSNLGYFNMPSQPVYYGTLPDENMPDDVKRNLNFYDQSSLSEYRLYNELDDYSSAGITWLGGTEGVTAAKASFSLIDQVGAIGYPISFGTLTAYQPKNPEKKVDKTEVNLGEDITYTVTQQISNRGNNARYNYTYSSFVFKDTLDASLSYKNFRVFDGAGNDVTESAGELTIDVNNLCYTFSTSYLENTMAYKGEDYRFEIQATVSNPGAGLDVIPNKAQVVFNNLYTLETNETITLINTAVLDLSKAATYEHRVGDEIFYTLTLRNTAEGSIAKNVNITDKSLPDDLIIEDAFIEGVPTNITYPIVEASEISAEERANASACSALGNHLSVSIKYLPFGVPVTITFKVKAPEKYNGFELVNTASATYDNPSLGAPNPCFDSEIVWINTPDLSPLKTAGTASHEVGDTIKYAIDITNENRGTVARDVVIIDTFETPGIELDRNSLVVSDTAGNIITDSCTIVQNTHTQGFKILTHRKLVNIENYSKYDVENGPVIQSVQNPLKDTSETSLHLEYSVKVVDPELAGKEVHNTVTTECNENPGGGDETDTPINGPVLSIDKQVSHKQSHKNDTISFLLTVKQIREKVVAENIVIDDHFETEYVSLKAETIEIYNEAWENITESCTITFDANLNIETHRNLDDQQTLYVAYDMNVIETPGKGSLLNTASAGADNAIEVIDKEMVTVNENEPGNLEVIKSSNPASGSKVIVGEVITYTLTFANTGGASLAQVAVYDAIPKHTSLLSFEEVHEATYYEETDSLGWNIKEIKPGEHVALSFNVIVDPTANLDDSILNLASYATEMPGTPLYPLPDETNQTEHIVSETNSPGMTNESGAVKNETTDNPANSSRGKGAKHDQTGSLFGEATPLIIGFVVLVAAGLALYGIRQLPIWSRRGRKDYKRYGKTE